MYTAEGLARSLLEAMCQVDFLRTAPERFEPKRLVALSKLLKEYLNECHMHRDILYFPDMVLPEAIHLFNRRPRMTHGAIFLHIWSQAARIERIATRIDSRPKTQARSLRFLVFLHDYVISDEQDRLQRERRQRPG